MKKRNRKKNEQGFALLEAVVVMMIFMILASILYGISGMEHRMETARISEKEAYYAAVSAVRLMAEEVLLEEAGETEVRMLTDEEGMKKRRTMLRFEPEEMFGDGSESKEVSIPVTIWSERDGDRLLLSAEAESGEKTKLVTLQLERRLRLEEELETEVWIPVCYQIGKDEKEDIK